MLTPSLIAPITPFYAIGNTPAINLTRSLPQGLDADVLLLGCGDVRHILYTAYSEQGFPSRKLDVTCCDVQEHIVARNVLLLSFLCEGHATTPTEVLWNVYYHRYLNESDMQVLHTQVRKLLDVSVSLQTWHSCPYGAVLRFCDQATLDSVRAVWWQYDSAVSAKNTKLYQDKFRSAMKKTNEHKGESFTVYTAARSAAPAYTALASDLMDSVENVWHKGVTDSSSPPAQHPNPVFATALSDSVTLAFPSNPLLSFHLAPAGLKLTDLSPLRPSPSANAGPSYSKLVQIAKLQFTEWTKAFTKLSSSIVVRFVLADCIAFCQTLQHSLGNGGTSANCYRRQLDTRALVLDDASYGTAAGAPRQFDVIDTSNLADHVGTLNLLVSAGPLLKDKPSSTLYTEIMARGTEGEKEKFESLLCGHTKTLSLLLGLAPIEFWTNATAVSSVDELVLALSEVSEAAKSGKPGGQPNIQSRLAWKLDHHLCGTPPAALSTDPRTLASILLRVYLDMFKHESPSALYAGLASPSKVTSFAYPQYHRGSFVAVVKAVCSKVHTDAKEVARQLTQMINSDRTLMLGNNYAQGLALEMSKYGLYSEPWLTGEIRRDPSKGTFCKWKEIPEAIAVTLVVPPSRWKPIFKAAADKGIGLTMEGHLRSIGRWHNMYADVHVTFGTVTTSGARDSDTYAVRVQEDSSGWLGNSTLVASFYASAAALQIDMQTSQVALCLQSTLQNAKFFQAKLGAPMAIFETALDDSSHVHVTKHTPGQQGLPVVGSLSRRADPAIVQPSDTTLTPQVDETTGRIVGITGRANIVSDEGKRLLQEKVPITLHQTSPFTIDIVFGERILVQTLTYRVPVTQENSKTRIARKSSYVEVVANLAEPGVSNILEDYIFPTVTDRGTSPGSTVPVTLNIPHLNLDSLPIIDATDKKSTHFLTTFTYLTFSDRECRQRQETNPDLAPSVRYYFKEALSSMLMISTGMQGNQTGLFAISHAKSGRNMLLFVSALRLDGANASVVLDAAVIPMTSSMLKDDDLASFLLIVRALEISDIEVDDAELVLWKKLLPALAERCRTWSHVPGCEYSVQGTVPVSLEPGGQVLCSCGQGKLPDNFVGVPDWEVAARYATRIAISPTFAVPFVEDVVDRALTKGIRDKGAAAGASVSKEVATCRTCGGTKGSDGGALKKCMRCLEARYCSGECQKKDWRRHRAECKEAGAYAA
ncbi:MYND finger [Coniochaeta ligniaria NRRL 30616]|uniref:MYND finger n=1 Tax=Coniochaeta ligniaria NRRL 30616 TaxID=1408157 RepID=A0A1J7IHQ8_9PEZI|nr:MYND finger [Coniochaeta ligniaria NRRL 30616]